MPKKTMAQNPTAVNHQLMRKLNRSLILSSLRKYPLQTRTKLAEGSGLTRSAISNLIDELIEKNLIHEVGYKPSTGGRPGVSLALNPKGGAAIAVKINASSVQCILSNFIGEILWEKRVPVEDTAPDCILPQTQQLVQQAVDFNNGQIRLLGIGVGITGIIGQDGQVLYSTHLGWQDITFREAWEKQFNMPVSVDNEVSLAALGENHYGSAAENSHFIYIEVGNGLGAGIVLDGKLYQGTNGFAGEIGYMMSLSICNGDSDAAYAWESMVNIPALLDMVAAHIKQSDQTMLKQEQLSFEAIIEAAQEHDPVAINALQKISRRLGLVIASTINIFDIPIVILGGELGKQLQPYLDVIQAQIVRYVIRTHPDTLNLRISTLAPDAALMGAVAQVFDDILQEPSWNVNL